jgi:beta-phosphoglucomutase-like phosphatase (HAD superfamily)
MSRLQALIFDVDGTLADTERDGHRVAFNQAFADMGLRWEWSEDLYGELLSITGGKERIAHYLKVHNPEFMLPENSAEFIAEIHAGKTRHYLQLLEHGSIPLRPGVQRLLQEARAAGLRLAIATTTTPENVDSLLRHTLGEESLSWFEVIAAGDIVGAKKPAPDIYHHTLKVMNLRPGDALAFEDSENGLRSARAAGLTTLITVNDYTLEHDFNDAGIVLDSMGEPDEPFTVLRGNAGGARYLNLEMLHRIHAHG